jgi:hypothetical protein
MARSLASTAAICSFRYASSPSLEISDWYSRSAAKYSFDDFFAQPDSTTPIAATRSHVRMEPTSRPFGPRRKF